MLHRSIALLTAIALAGCVQQPAAPATRGASAKSPREARSRNVSAEEQAVLYLHTAAEAAPRLGSGNEPTAFRDSYNNAVAKLTVLLRSADNGRLWGRPLTLSASGVTYHLRFHPGTHDVIWAPDYFDAFIPASEVPLKVIRKRNVQEGVGGALVGIRKKTPSEPFAMPSGVTAPVTAVLDFQGREATLALRDPGEQPKARVAGAIRPLAADFTAPLAYYPTVNEFWTGLMGAMHVSHYMGSAGLYLEQPYDPDRIPLVFVHGLISTPQLWRRVINAIEADPELRGHYQCWVFSYPTGNPVVYSALRLRQDLDKAQQLYGMPHGIVLVGHSMGGLLTRMQVTTMDLAAWDRVEGHTADRLFSGLPPDTLVHQAYLFNANPHIQRVIFICTPHRGSELATGFIGTIAANLVGLPGNLTGAIKNSMGDALEIASGYPHRIPNGVTGLSPKSPPLRVMDKLPVSAPYHTILGDRGKKNSPNSSDGVVAYWSSHLDSAQSEKIVPGPHGSCELPETIDELRRILRLHLKTASR